MGILVVTTIPHILHQGGWSIAKMQGHRQIPGFFHSFQRLIDRHIGRIALRRGSKIDGTLRQWYPPLRKSHLMHSIKCGIGKKQRIGICKDRYPQKQE